MGLLSAWKEKMDYEDGLKSCGVNPQSLPTEFNEIIRSYAKQKNEQLNTFFGKNSNISLTFSMQYAGAFAALCFTGTSNFKRYDGTYGVHIEDLRDVAQDRKSKGDDYSIETKVIQMANIYGILSPEFITTFNSLL